MIRHDVLKFNALNAKHRKTYRDKHEALGLCVSCPNPALPGTKYCGLCTSKSRQRSRKRYQKHKESVNERSQLRRQGYRSSGRCIICSRHLDSDMDAGNVVCTYCIVRPRGVG